MWEERKCFLSSHVAWAVGTMLVTPCECHAYPQTRMNAWKTPLCAVRAHIVRTLLENISARHATCPANTHVLALELETALSANQDL